MCSRYHFRELQKHFHNHMEVPCVYENVFVTRVFVTGPPRCRQVVVVPCAPTTSSLFYALGLFPLVLLLFRPRFVS